MIDNPWYTDWFGSPFYRQLLSETEGKQQLELAKNLLVKLRGNISGQLFDTACGNGSRSVGMASLGFEVTGVDLSAENISIAKQQETEKLHFFIHDLRLPFFSNYFDVAINMSPGFGFYRTRREHEAAIRTIARSLKPGGVLLLDYPNVHYTEANWPASESKEVNGTGYDIQRWQDEDLFYERINITDASLISPMEVTTKLAKFGLGDFNEILSFQGLQVQEVFGNIELAAYDVNRSSRLIIIADKTPARPADKAKRLYSDGRKTDSLT